MTAVLHSRTELAAARSRFAGRVGLVPTMGALHDGHTALLDRARDECDAVVVSVFVNPAQFGPAEDFNRYPRSLESDLARCRRAGVDVVWVPSVDEVYPDGVAGVTVSPGPLGSELEGVVRPTHFSGVLTVVVKLFHLVRPHVGYFGEKDYQQLTLIRQMSADLDLGVDVVGVPTMRERDGLALSSRNAYLSSADRRAALALSRALFAGRAAAGAGADAVVAEAKRVAGAEPGLDVDYLVLRNPDLGPAPEHGPARLLVAGRVGTTRLIDNVEVVL
jgi:pantoate--beta-alanine ligase